MQRFTQHFRVNTGVRRSDKTREKEKKKRKEKLAGYISTMSVSHPNWTLNTNCTVNTVGDTEREMLLYHGTDTNTQ